MMSDEFRSLKDFIKEEVWRNVSRSAGLVGGMNIGKHSGETVNPVPNLGTIERDEEKEEQGNRRVARERRQDGDGRPRGRGNGRHSLQRQLRASKGDSDPVWEDEAESDSNPSWR